MDVHQTVELHHYVEGDWEFKKSIVDHPVPIHQAPYAYNSEVLHWQVT
jgi:hypothetical protein